MNVTSLLNQLQVVRPTRNGWTSRCPAHPDKSPSLSIREEDGKILMHCFAGCSIETICAALGIRVGQLFSKPNEATKSEPEQVRKLRQKITGLRSRLAPSDRQRGVTIVLAQSNKPEAAIARALALAIEGELVQVALHQEAQ